MPSVLSCPDLFVHCGELIRTTCETPVVIFEVLSTSTAQHDLTHKKRAYQATWSVQAIV